MPFTNRGELLLFHAFNISNSLNSVIKKMSYLIEPVEHPDAQQKNYFLHNNALIILEIFEINIKFFFFKEALSR